MKKKREWINNNSLSTRIIKSYVIQLLIISFIILNITFYFSLTGMFRFINSYGQKRAYPISSTIKSILDLPFLINSQNENLVLYGKFEDISPEDFREYLISQFHAAKPLSSIGLGLENGFYGNIQNYTEETFYWSKRNGISGISENWEIDRNGRLLGIVKESVNNDHRKRLWYELAQSSKKSSWSPVYNSVNPEKLVISAINPIYNESYEFLGVAVSSLSLSVIQDIIQSIPSRGEDEIYIIEKNGDIVAGTTTELPFTVNKNELTRLNIKDSKDQILRYIHETDHLNRNDPGVMALIRKNRGLYFISYHYLSDSRGIDWIIIISEQARVYLEPIIKSLSFNIIIIIIFIGLSIMFGKITARNIIIPIQTLMDAAQKINKGDLDQRVSESRKDELGQLNNSFNLMAERISDLVENLEKKVEERTGQLEKSNEELILSQKRVELHFKNTPLALIEWDKDYHIIGWNPSAERIFGYKAEEVINIHSAYLLLSDKDDEKDLIKNKNEMIRNKRGIHNINEIITKDGRLITCEWHSTPLIDEKGELMGITSMARDITEEVKLRKELLEMTRTDGLTGIANRRIFDEYLLHEWKRAERSLKPLALIMADIDFFKNYNDYYGHLEGDSCLKMVARTLSEEMKRPGDIATRYGGEEFACILPNTSLEGALSVAQGILEALDRLKLPHADSSVSPFVTLSLGVAWTIPGRQWVDPHEFIRAADQKLYLAKTLGRNQIQS